MVKTEFHEPSQICSGMSQQICLFAQKVFFSRGQPNFHKLFEGPGIQNFENLHNKDSTRTVSHWDTVPESPFPGPWVLASLWGTRGFQGYPQTPSK